MEEAQDIEARSRLAKAALHAQLEEYLNASRMNMLDAQMMIVGLREGDPSLIRMCASETREKFLLGEDLSPVDRVFISELLKSVASSRKAALAVSSCEPKRGAPRKRAEEFHYAWGVLRSVLDHKADSMESAIAVVADSTGVSDSKVKQAWMAWKKALLMVLSEVEGRDGATVLKEAVLASKTGKRTRRAK